MPFVISTMERPPKHHEPIYLTISKAETLLLKDYLEKTFPDILNAYDKARKSGKAYEPEELAPEKIAIVGMKLFLDGKDLAGLFKKPISKTIPR